MRELESWIEAASEADAAHYTLLTRDIERFLDRPAEVFSQPAVPAPPPGAPIGEPAMDWLTRLEPWCSSPGNGTEE